MIYVYDGSFFGYLSAVFDAWHDGLQHTEDIRCDGAGDLFGRQQYVPADGVKAKRILDGLQAQCGGKTCHFLYYAFLAEQPQREMKLLQYIRQAFRLKGEFLHHLSEPAVWEVRQWARKTGNERHKLLGLARFQELKGGMLYCPLAPTCCVVPVMAPHFVKRLGSEEWVIHDRQRRIGVYYDRHEAVLVDIPKVLQRVGVSAQEEEFAALWKQYYRTIAIAERRNDPLRRQFMPKKYWPYIIEVRDGENSR